MHACLTPLHLCAVQSFHPGNRTSQRNIVKVSNFHDICAYDKACTFLTTRYLPCLLVMDLIYWKDTERSGMVLTGLVVGLLSLFQLSIITVVSTVSLAIMCFTISVRIYYQLLYILSWGDGEHPFK